MNVEDVIYNYYEKCVWFWFMYPDAEIDEAMDDYNAMKRNEEHE